MKNKQDFILKVEPESAISSLNSFVYKCFDTTTDVWTDCAEHNILMFVTDGEATCSRVDAACETTLHRKVTVLPAEEPFVAEFGAGCEILTYSFDGYLPMDISIYDRVARERYTTVYESIVLDIPEALHHELVNITKNIGVIGGNETLTHLEIRKVTGIMRKCLEPGKMAKLLATGGSELGSEIFRYIKIAENRVNSTKKHAGVIF